MRRLATVAGKGGVLKTTTTVSLAAAWAGQGKRVLVVDADTQGNSGVILLDGQPPRRPTLSEVLTGDADAEDAILATTIPGVDLIPAAPDLADVNVSLSAEVGRERRLRVALADLSGWDVMLVDTGPTRSLLTTNVLNAVDEIITPIAPGLFGFLGLAQLQADINQVRKFLENKTVKLSGVLLTLMDRTAVSKDFEREIREAVGTLAYDTTIPVSVKFREAEARRTTIIGHAPKSPGALAYQALAVEVWNRGGKTKRNEPAHRDLRGDDAAA